jgi:hypothetical protein
MPRNDAKEQLTIASAVLWWSPGGENGRRYPATAGTLLAAPIGLNQPRFWACGGAAWLYVRALPEQEQLPHLLAEAAYIQKADKVPDARVHSGLLAISGYAQAAHAASARSFAEMRAAYPRKLRRKCGWWRGYLF